MSCSPSLTMTGFNSTTGVNQPIHRCNWVEPFTDKPPSVIPGSSSCPTLRQLKTDCAFVSLCFGILHNVLKDFVSVRFHDHIAGHVCLDSCNPNHFKVSLFRICCKPVDVGHTHHQTTGGHRLTCGTRLPVVHVQEWEV